MGTAAAARADQIAHAEFQDDALAVGGRRTELAERRHAKIELEVGQAGNAPLPGARGD